MPETSYRNIQGYLHYLYVSLRVKDMEQLRQVEEYTKQILPQWNLIVNATKTEFVKVNLPSKTDYQDQPLINNELGVQVND